MKTIALKFSTFLFMISVLTVSCQEKQKKSPDKTMNAKEKMAMQDDAKMDNTDMAMTNTFPKAKPNSYWKENMTSEQYDVMVNKGTEPAFNNALYDNKEKGVYVSAATGEPMFSSEDKFHSGTGWPSFTKPINDDAVVWVKDTSNGMNRDEIVEASTGLHLGHVFHDGPAPTHLRFCMNSAALKFKKQ